MPPEQNGVVARRASIRAGYQVSRQRFDTPTHNSVQPADLFLGIRLRGLRPLPKGALIGVADIELLGGLLVHDCPAFRSKDGGAWTALSAKPVVDYYGKQTVDANGKRHFAPMLERCSRELVNRFSPAVIALEQACPGVLNGDKR